MFTFILIRYTVVMFAVVVARLVAAMELHCLQRENHQRDAESHEKCSSAGKQSTSLYPKFQPQIPKPDSLNSKTPQNSKVC